MKHLVLLLFLLPGLHLAAQEGPAITDQLIRWGELHQDKAVVGHYSITVKADESLQQGIYTLSLYDTDLHAVGSKTYPASATFSVQDVAYNGTHLAVLTQDGDAGAVEILDGSATTIAVHQLREPKENASGIVYSAPGGFLVVEEFKIRPNIPTSATNYQVEYLATASDQQGWSRRIGDPDIRSEHSTADVVGIDEEVLLLRVWRRKVYGSNEKVACSLHAVELTTGRDRFTVDLPEARPEQAMGIVAATHLDQEYLLLMNQFDYADKRQFYPGTLDLVSYDGSGKLLERIPIDLHRLAAEELEHAGLPALNERSEFVIRTAEFTPGGDFSLVVESFFRQKKVVTYTEQFVLGFNRRAEAQDVLALSRERLTVPAYFIGRGTGPVLMGPSMKDQRLAQTLSQHGGPLNHAMSVKQGNSIYHYLWDRTFTEYAADYLGVHAIIYRDGKLLKEYVPLKDTELAWVFPAREGYFLLLEPRFAESTLVPRLEKLTN